MAVIPGSIPVTGFIGPTDSTDVYPVTDALYGIDGLRNVPTNVERNAIPFERRRTGMLVGTQNNLKYWKLLPPSPGPDWNYNDSDWNLAFDLSVGPLDSTGGTVLVFATLNSPSPAGSPLADEYTGTSGSPGISDYDPTTIYLISFDTNNIERVRIDIDGVGLLEIKKGSIEGLISLEPNDLLAGITYAAVFNGIELQLLNSIPTAASGVKEHLVAGDHIIVHPDFQYLVYGNLTIDAGATLENHGKVVIINGAFIQNGTFDNTGTIQLVNLALDNVVASDKYVEPATAYLASVVNTITHNLGAGDEIFISIVDTVTNENVSASIENFTTDSVDITFSQNVTAKIIIRS